MNKYGIKSKYQHQSIQLHSPTLGKVALGQFAIGIGRQPRGEDKIALDVLAVR